jgi:hypothetical protein
MTQSDGYDDFLAIYENHPHKNRVIGYCFYHGQDLERVVSGGPLLFSFGPSNSKLEATEGPKIGQLIEQCLTVVGFKVYWDGTIEQRISIPKFNWQRRAVLETEQ